MVTEFGTAVYRFADFSYHPWILRTLRTTDYSYHSRTFRTITEQWAWNSTTLTTSHRLMKAS